MFHAEGTACANGAPTKEGGGGCSGDWKKSTLTEVKRGRAGAGGGRAQVEALLFGYHIDKVKKTVLTVFPHSVLYLNITNHPFLKQIVTGNEKWVLYNNVEQKRPRGK